MRNNLRDIKKTAKKDYIAAKLKNNFSHLPKILDKIQFIKKALCFESN